MVSTLSCLLMEPPEADRRLRCRSVKAIKDRIYRYGKDKKQEITSEM